MTDRFDFSRLLSKAEQKVLERPEIWRWISTIVTSDVGPVHRPDHLKWAKDHCHTPPQRELFIALSGETIGILGNKVYPIVPGTVVLFNSRERHGNDAAIEHRKFRHLWLHMSNRHAIFANLHEIDGKGNRTDTDLKFMSGTNANLMMDVWDRCASGPVVPTHWSFLKALITTTFFESISDSSKTVAASPYQLIVDPVCEHIKKHLDKDLSLANMARFAGYSPYFFHRLFLRHTGKTLHRYIIDVRLEKAKELLRNGQSVQAVSEQIGMVSVAYFSRFFKTHTRLSPSNWRNYH